jgi:hypothetical protein
MLSFEEKKRHSLHLFTKDFIDGGNANNSESQLTPKPVQSRSHSHNLNLGLYINFTIP